MNVTPQAPAGAVFFKLARLVEIKGRNKETGRKWTAPKREALYGEPTKSGEVPEQWPVSDFNIKHILEHWGPGRYMVTWLGGGGERVGSRTFVLSAAPAAAGSSLRPRATRSRAVDDDAPSDARGPERRDLGGLGTFDLIAMLDERSERAARQAEERANAQRENDRQYMTLIVQMMNQRVAAAPAAAGPAVDMAREMALLRREIGVTIAERMNAMQTQLTGLIDDNAPTDDPRDLPMPRDLGEAVEQVGVSLLREVTSAAPEVVGEILPAVMRMMRAKGIQANPDTLRRAREVNRRLRDARATADAAARAYANVPPPAPPEDDDGNDEIDDDEPEAEGAHAQ